MFHYTLLYSIHRGAQADKYSDVLVRILQSTVLLRSAVWCTVLLCFLLICCCDKQNNLISQCPKVISTTLQNVTAL